MVLANFLFGELNAVRHTRTCVNCYWRVLNLVIFYKNSPNHQIKNLAKVSCYTVLSCDGAEDQGIAPTSRDPFPHICAWGRGLGLGMRLPARSTSEEDGSSSID